MKLCNKCWNVVIEHSEKYCSNCIESATANTRERYKQYDKTRIDKDIMRLYNCKRWDMIKDVVCRLYNNVDVYSYYALGRLEYIEMYHHITEAKEDKKKFYDVSNIIGLTHANHAKVHGAYNRNPRNKEQMQRLLLELQERYLEEMGSKI